MKPLPKKQQGVAIITALLIVAIATTISTDISTDLQLDVRRTSNLLTNEQSVMYTLAAEDWAQRILRDDRQDNNYDHLGEGWATEIPPLPVEGGTIQGKLTDLQGCFNINALYRDGAVNAVAKTRFELMLARLKLDQTLSQSIIDWIDIDLDTTIPNGAEDSHYTSLDQPYRTANTAMQSISELRLIRGFEEQKNYTTLAEKTCAFGKYAPINVNTAPEEVLLSLASGMTETEVTDIVQKREEDPFPDMATFTGFNNLNKKIKDIDGLTTSTNYFLLETESTIGQARTIMYSIIYRDDSGKTQVIARSQGVY